MDSITLENYRCFRVKQTARLAPLTLLVGNNSTGKTSFLAILRALWDAAFRNDAPDFREEPFDLGTFHDIAHNRGGRGSQAGFFRAEFSYRERSLSSDETEQITFGFQFEELNASPFPAMQALLRKDVMFVINMQDNGVDLFRFFKREGEGFEKKLEERVDHGVGVRLGTRLASISDWIRHIEFGREFWRQSSSAEESDLRETENATPKPLLPTVDDIAELKVADVSLLSMLKQRPFASAPVRSRPRRTYDPTRPSQDPEGEYVPNYLASTAYGHRREWMRLKSNLEEFGRESGLFDEIAIKLLGKSGGSPFQVQVRKFGRRLKGVKRNLIDVGYGVSQSLPLLTELLRLDAPSMFLLQQPEVHLHPSAQAALGSLFCKIAEPERQLIVETHSNYILDRVRMDVRDKKTNLKASDVSILFFEPGELDVTIHSLRLDEQGNVLGAPPGYGQFFMDETRRSIGL